MLLRPMLSACLRSISLVLFHSAVSSVVDATNSRMLSLKSASDTDELTWVADSPLPLGRSQRRIVSSVACPLRGVPMPDLG